MNIEYKCLTVNNILDQKLDMLLWGGGEWPYFIFGRGGGMDVSFKELLDMLVGPLGGAIAMGGLLGGRLGWMLSERNVTKIYKENVQALKKDGKEMKAYFIKELLELRQEMKLQNAACKKEVDQLHSKIYSLMKSENDSS